MPSTIKTRFTISLPAGLVKRLEASRKAQYRSRSEVIRAALHAYLQMNHLPEEDATTKERRAIARGRAAFVRGEYATLDNVLHELGHRSRRSRPQGA